MIYNPEKCIIKLFIRSFRLLSGLHINTLRWKMQAFKILILFPLKTETFVEISAGKDNSNLQQGTLSPTDWSVSSVCAAMPLRRLRKRPVERLHCPLVLKRYDINPARPVDLATGLSMDHSMCVEGAQCVTWRAWREGEVSIINSVLYLMNLSLMVSQQYQALRDR